MGEVSDIRREPRSDIVCLEGNGSRPSHFGDGYKISDVMYTLNSTEVHAVCLPLDHHPNDSRLRIRHDGICQSLTSRMGTGGGNVPLVLFVKSKRAQSSEDYEMWIRADVSNTLNAFDTGDARSTTLVVNGSIDSSE